jgi:hypothetical protein
MMSDSRSVQARRQELARDLAILIHRRLRKQAIPAAQDQPPTPDEAVAAAEPTRRPGAGRVRRPRTDRS